MDVSPLASTADKKKKNNKDMEQAASLVAAGKHAHASSSASPAAAASGSVGFASFLRERYQLQQAGDRWHFKQTSGDVRITALGKLELVAPSGESAGTPNKLLVKYLKVASKASGVHYTELKLHFGRTGVRTAWRDLKDEYDRFKRAQPALESPPLAAVAAAGGGGGAGAGAAPSQQLPATKTHENGDHHQHQDRHQEHQPGRSPAKQMRNKPIKQLFVEKEKEREKENEKQPQEGADGGEVPAPVGDKAKAGKRARRSKEELLAVFGVTEGKCYLCRGPLVFANRRHGQEGAWHLEHVIAYSRRSDLDIVGNLLPAHVQCNLKKSAMSITEAVSKWNFPVLTAIIDHSALIPEVMVALQQAKKLARVRESGVVVVEEELSDEAPSSSSSPSVPNLTIYPEGIQARGADLPPADYRIEEGRVTKIPNRKALGRGACGKVRLGLWKGRNVVIKKAFPGREELLVNEANMLCSLQHENLVNLYGWFQRNVKSYLVMEYVARGDLNNDTTRKEVDPLFIARDVARGIAFLHLKGFIHRDLKVHHAVHPWSIHNSKTYPTSGHSLIHSFKPANILVTEEGGAKITDFGIAKRAEPQRNKQTQCGTAYYMAPEVRKAPYRYSFPVDVWSFGKIIHYLIHGEQEDDDAEDDSDYEEEPTQTEKRSKAEKSKKQVPERDLRGCDRDLLDLAKRCCTKKPEDRPTIDKIVMMLENLVKEYH